MAHFRPITILQLYNHNDNYPLIHTAQLTCNSGTTRDAIRNPKIRIIRQSIRSERIMDASGWIKDIRFNPKQHPMIVQRCTIAHSNRRNETIRMSYCASLYDHWMPRYSAKRQTSAFSFYDYAKFYVLPNISASSDRIEMHNSSFESSQCNDSNELLCIPVRSLDTEIFGKPSKIGSIVNKKCQFLTFCRISRHPLIVQRCT